MSDFTTYMIFHCKSFCFSFQLTLQRLRNNGNLNLLIGQPTLITLFLHTSIVFNLAAMCLRLSFERVQDQDQDVCQPVPLKVIMICY